VTGCETLNVETHHWAPRAVFGPDSDRWPTSPLCPRHHQEWHRRVNAATEPRSA
jgi:hypothetical protein